MTISIVAHYARRFLFTAACLLGVTACAHKPPTIAHTHIGHAVTAFDGTPGEKGLFTVAEERAEAALQHAQAAARPGNNLNEVQAGVKAVIDLYAADDFGIRNAMDEAAKHIEFAATSSDASANVQRTSGEIRAAADGILNRSDLIVLLGNDVLNTRSLDEATVLAQQILLLAQTNVNGDAQGEAGVAQIRTVIDDMIDAEDPEYVTVDRWYLFHLVRLPDCNTCWAWRKWANSSNRGY